MITTVTLNASIDKAYEVVNRIEGGTVMRVAECRNSAGGKGLNVARVIHLLGEKVEATGLSGGFNGKYLESMLEKDNIPNRFVHIAGETRSCINILDPAYGSTEFLEPGCEVTAAEERDFIMQFPAIIAQSNIITMSGSVPKGISADIYSKLINICKKQNKKVVLDTSGALLKAGITAGPTLVKPNRDEIEALFDIKVKDIRDVIYYAKKIRENGIPYVVISLGGDGALFVCEEGVYHGISPKVEAVNTVGCGDSMVGAFAVALERNYQPSEALKFAVAVGTANALSPDTGNFDAAILSDLLDRVTVTKVED